MIVSKKYESSRVEKTKSCERVCHKIYNDENEVLSRFVWEDPRKHYQIGARDREQITPTKKVEINVITEKGGRRGRKTRAREVRNRAREEKISHEFVSDFGYHVRSRLAEIFYDFVVRDISGVRLQV